MHRSGGVNQFNAFTYLNNLAFLRLICFGYNKQHKLANEIFYSLIMKIELNYLTQQIISYNV